MMFFLQEKMIFFPSKLSQSQSGLIGWEKGFEFCMAGSDRCDGISVERKAQHIWGEAIQMVDDAGRKANRISMKLKDKAIPLKS